VENAAVATDCAKLAMVRVRFGDVALDADAMELERGGRRVAIEPQVMDVLDYLVRHRDRVVPKTELLDEIWGDRFVSESALSSRIKSARRAIGDNGRDQRLIRTVHGRGFRFVGEVLEGGGQGIPTVPAAPDPEGGTPSPHALASGIVGGLAAGRGRAVAIAGSGQACRHLVEDLLHAADDAGVVSGRGRGVGELRVFASVAEALDEVVSRRPGVLAAVPDRCRAELEALIGGGPPTAANRVFVAARELVRAAASGGVVIAVEDVHLVDPHTVDLLRHLARAARRLPVAVVVTLRAGAGPGEPFETVVLDAAEPATDHLPANVLTILRTAAVLGEIVEIDDLGAATALGRADAARAVALAEAAGHMERTQRGHRFVDPAEARKLATEVSPGERVDIWRAVAQARVARDADPGSIADALDAAGARAEAAAFQLAAARAARDAQLHGEVLRRTAHADVANDATRFGLLELRADVLAQQGDPGAIPSYRRALLYAPPDAVPWLVARMARAHVRNGDLAAAADAMAGVADDDHPGVRLVAALLAYLQGDLDTSETLLDSVRDVALAPGAPAQMLDVITLQGMIAHSRGHWSDRLRQELRLAGASVDLAQVVFDSHVCVAQYLLYGPTGPVDVIRVADELRSSAEAIGSLPAVAFATTLEGEARMLAGDLDVARDRLTESVRLHRALDTDTGLAHALQRLAEAHLHLGERAEAERVANEAMTRARWSPLSQHLLQRTYGTLIAAAPDPGAAAAVADDALATIDGPDACHFCHVMVAAPAAVAYAAVGRLDDARAQLAAARRAAARWEGPAWPAAVDEAEAMLARAEGRDDEAVALLERAARAFDQAALPLEAARCREAM
jgi:DNA-binding winged helix-turn-helix (wHTH) protein/tetratricopeptide (TPR) repeat protein